MFRLWCKLFDESNHLMKDMVYANSDIDINRTKKIFDGIKEACYTFDLSEPIWLDSNIADFQRHSKVRFTKDNLLIQLTLLIWKFRLLKKIKSQYSHP